MVWMNRIMRDLLSPHSLDLLYMVDEKPINNQLHQFQERLRKIEIGETKLSEEFKVSSLLDKLSSSWNNFAKSQIQKQGELSFTQVLNSIRVEDQHREKVKKSKEIRRGGYCKFSPKPGCPKD
jgi:gag-polypeptide of LTR copia-type